MADKEAQQKDKILRKEIENKLEVGNITISSTNIPLHDIEKLYVASALDTLRSIPAKECLITLKISGDRKETIDYAIELIKLLPTKFKRLTSVSVQTGAIINIKL
jgi:hypothetical protein